MPKVREFVKKLGPEMYKKFEVQWAGGNKERLEQLQELRLKEKEEAAKSYNGDELNISNKWVKHKRKIFLR